MSASSVKLALESLILVLQKSYPTITFFIVRPPKLKGEINIPFSGELILAADLVANKLVTELEKSSSPGVVKFVRQFRKNDIEMQST